MRVLFFLAVLPWLSFSQNITEQAKQFIASKNYKSAETILLPYLKENPNNIEVIELLGDTFGQQKKWDDAIKHYKKLLTFKPNNANFHYKYGGVLGMKALNINKLAALNIIGDVKKAFTKAAELDKNHIPTRWALVELYMQLPFIVGGSKKKSLKYAEELYNLSSLNGHLAKGYIYEYDNEPKLAKEHYIKALEISKKHNNYNRNAINYQIGKICATYNLQLKKGKKHIQTYIKNHSTIDGVPKAWAYYRLAEIYKHENDKENALKYINKAIAALPKIEVFKTEKETINML